MKLLPARDIRSLPNDPSTIHLWNSQVPDFDLPIGSLAPHPSSSFPPDYLYAFMLLIRINGTPILTQLLLQIDLLHLSQIPPLKFTDMLT